jgi:hypothetical protein
MDKYIFISLIAVFFKLGGLASETVIMASYQFNLENSQVKIEGTSNLHEMIRIKP